jgi:hypothetical protein
MPADDWDGLRGHYVVARRPVIVVGKNPKKPKLFLCCIARIPWGVIFRFSPMICLRPESR